MKKIIVDDGVLPIHKVIKAQKVKDDEFYTYIEDVHEEVKLAKEELFGKKILCFADDFKYSSFYKYFKENFESLGISLLTATCKSANGEKVFKVVYDGKEEIKSELVDGSCFSDEVQKEFEQADILITNPPFSILTDIMKQIHRFNKKFLLIIPLTAIINSYLIDFFVSGECTLGINFINHFAHPSKGHTSVMCKWLTNLNYAKHPNRKRIIEKFKPELIHTVSIERSNCGRINLDRSNLLFTDYKDYVGELLVPISFFSPMLDNHHEQFKLAGISYSPIVSGKRRFTRLIVKKLF